MIRFVFAEEGPLSHLLVSKRNPYPLASRGGPSSYLLISKRTPFALVSQKEPLLHLKRTPIISAREWPPSHVLALKGLLSHWSLEKRPYCIWKGTLSYLLEDDPYRLLRVFRVQGLEFTVYGWELSFAQETQPLNLSLCIVGCNNGIGGFHRNLVTF